MYEWRGIILRRAHLTMQTKLYHFFRNYGAIIIESVLYDKQQTYFFFFTYYLWDVRGSLLSALLGRIVKLGSILSTYYTNI